MDRPQRTHSEAPEAAPALREYFLILWRRKLTVLLLFVVITAAAVAGAYLTPAVFTADTSILVKLGREFLYRPEVGGLEGARALTLEEMVNSQVEILKSRDLAADAIQQLGAEKLYPQIIQDTPDREVAMAKSVVAFQDNLVVASVPESGIIKMAFTHLEPTTAAEALNTLVEAFKEKHLQLFGNASAEFLRQQVDQYRNELAEAETALQVFKEENKIFELTEQRASMVKQRVEFQTELRTTQFRTMELDGQLKALKDDEGGSAVLSLGGLLPNGALSRQAAALISERSEASSALQEVDAKITELTGNLARFEERQRGSGGSAQPGVEQFRSLDEARIRLLDLQLKYVELRHKYRKESREATAVEKEMLLVKEFLKRRGAFVEEVMQAGISDELSALRVRRKALADHAAQISEQLRALVENERSRQIRLIETELAGLQHKKETLSTDLAKLDAEVSTFSAKEQRLLALQRRATIAERNYQMYLGKYEQARTSEKLDEEKIVNIKAFETAIPPVSAEGQSRKVKIALGAAAGLLAGVAAAFFLEMVTR